MVLPPKTSGEAVVLHLGCTSGGHSGRLHGGRGLRTVPVCVAGMRSWIGFLEGEREVLSASPLPPPPLCVPLTIFAHTRPPQSVQVLPNDFAEIPFWESGHSLALWEGDGPPPHCDGLCPVLSPLLPMADVVTHSSPGLHRGAEDQGGTRWALP